MTMTNDMSVEKQKNDNRLTRKWISLALRYLLAFVLIIFATVPGLWVVSTSFNPAKSLGSGSFFPEDPSFVNYQDLLTNEFFPYAQWFINSLKISTITTILTVIVTCLAGYTLSRFRFTGRRQLMGAILILNVFPAILAMVAIFSMIQQLGLQIPFIGLDTHGGLILIYVSGSMGINVLMVKAYIDSIPIELDESALVDGCNTLANIYADCPPCHDANYHYSWCSDLYRDLRGFRHCSRFAQKFR